jgi:hypothetical protein
VIFTRIRVVIAKNQIFRFFGTSNSSQFWTGLIADGKSGYFTVCLDLEVIPVMFLNKSVSRMSVFCSLQTMETANGIWREMLTHPVRSLTHIAQEI